MSYSARDTQSAPSPRLSCRSINTEGVLPGIGIGSLWDAGHNERNSCWGKVNAIVSPRPAYRLPLASESKIDVIRPAGLRRGDMEVPARWEYVLNKDRASSERRCSSERGAAKERSDSVRSWHAGRRAAASRERRGSAESDPWAGIVKPIPEAIFKGTSITTDSTVFFNSPRLGEGKLRRDLVNDKRSETSHKSGLENLLWGSAALGVESCVPDLFSDRTPGTSPRARARTALRAQKTNLSEQKEECVRHSQLQAPYGWTQSIERRQTKVVDVTKQAPYAHHTEVKPPTESVSLQENGQLPYASDEQPPSPTLSLPGTSRRLRSPLSPRYDEPARLEASFAECLPSDPAEAAEVRGAAAGVGPQQDQYHHKSRRPALQRRDPPITRPRQPFPGAVGLWSEVLSCKQRHMPGAVPTSQSPRSLSSRVEVLERVVVKGPSSKRQGLAAGANSPQNGCRDLRSPKLKSPRACWR